MEWVPPYVIWETVSPVEVLWTAPALIGFLRYGYRYWYATWRRRVARREGINGGVQRMATIRAIRFLIVAVVFEVWLLIGVNAMVLPPGPASDPGDAAAWLGAGLLVFAETLLFAGGEIVDRLERALVHDVLTPPQRAAAAVAGITAPHGEGLGA